jgi:hypothetical protein
MDMDIGPLLGDWEHHPEQVQARLIIGRDGREKLQLRVELGLLQMEADGRPDGRTVGEFESLLEYHLAQLAQRRPSGGAADSYQLDHDACLALQAEALQYYHRYICCFALEDFERAARDTARNLRVFDLVWERAADTEDKWDLEQYRPYVLMMNVRARAMLAVQADEWAQATEIVSEGIRNIHDFYKSHNATELAAASREIAFLRAFRRELRDGRPATQEDLLRMRLRDALAREDYQAAARLRDQLHSIGPDRDAPNEDGADAPADRA